MWYGEREEELSFATCDKTREWVSKGMMLEFGGERRRSVFFGYFRKKIYVSIEWFKGHWEEDEGGERR